MKGGVACWYPSCDVVALSTELKHPLSSRAGLLATWLSEHMPSPGRKDTNGFSLERLMAVPTKQSKMSLDLDLSDDEGGPLAATLSHLNGSAPTAVGRQQREPRRIMQETSNTIDGSNGGPTPDKQDSRTLRDEQAAHKDIQVAEVYSDNHQQGVPDTDPEATGGPSSGRPDDGKRHGKQEEHQLYEEKRKREEGGEEQPNKLQRWRGISRPTGIVSSEGGDHEARQRTHKSRSLGGEDSALRHHNDEQSRDASQSKDTRGMKGRGSTPIPADPSLRSSSRHQAAASERKATSLEHLPRSDPRHPDHDPDFHKKNFRSYMPRSDPRHPDHDPNFNKRFRRGEGHQHWCPFPKNQLALYGRTCDKRH